MKKYAVRKFDGDDIYSYAVFYAADLRGLKGVVFHGQARPIVAGCSRSEAVSRRDQMEKKGNANASN